MVTFIEIIEGSNEGSRYKISDGVTLGRSQADIVIKDPKVSSRHAEVSRDGKGQLVLIDLDSSNGIHIAGRRVKKVALIPGVIFEVGRTQFKVVTVEEEIALDFARLMTWRNVLQTSLPDCKVQNTEPGITPERFSPAIKLNFIQGIQADEEIILGWGPRKAGSDCLDIELFDPDAPKDAFELLAGPGQVEIKILAPGRVTVNSKAIDGKMLRDGDTISIGNTLIKVSYL